MPKQTSVAASKRRAWRQDLAEERAKDFVKVGGVPDNVTEARALGATVREILEEAVHRRDRQNRAVEAWLPNYHPLEAARGSQEPPPEVTQPLHPGSWLAGGVAQGPPTRSAAAEAAVWQQYAAAAAASQPSQQQWSSQQRQQHPRTPPPPPWKAGPANSPLGSSQSTDHAGSAAAKAKAKAAPGGPPPKAAAPPNRTLHPYSVPESAAAEALLEANNKIFVVWSPSRVRGVWVTPTWAFVVAAERRAQGERVDTLEHACSVLLSADWHGGAGNGEPPRFFLGV